VSATGEHKHSCGNCNISIHSSQPSCVAIMAPSPAHETFSVRGTCAGLFEFAVPYENENNLGFRRSRQRDRWWDDWHMVIAGRPRQRSLGSCGRCTHIRLLPFLATCHQQRAARSRLTLGQSDQAGRCAVAGGHPVTPSPAPPRTMERSPASAGRRRTSLCLSSPARCRRRYSIGVR
jgi:hypothetical protein